MDKKEALYVSLELNNLWDLGISIEIEWTIAHNIYKDNRLTPLVKHYESLEDVYGRLPELQKKQQHKFLNQYSSMVFHLLERGGIGIEPKTFERHFHKREGIQTYGLYNLKTITQRPSCVFNGVNYLALNKSDGSRKSFIPLNDKLIEFDLRAFHVRLAGRLIDYTFSTDDVHGYFANLYGLDYDKAKELTFTQMYGHILDEYKDLVFFKKLDEFIKKNWDSFNNNGYIECLISGHRYTKEQYPDMNPRKLFNYILQNYETSVNVLILKDLIKVLWNKKSKVILYTYDAFLIDYDNNDDIDEIENVFKDHGFPVKMKEGYDYDFGGSLEYV